MASGKLFLIHWNEAEAEALAAPLRAQGWNVATEAQDGARAYSAIRADPPDAVVIYLRRLPSHGRETAAALTTLRATQRIPIIFVEGYGETLEKAKARVPSAICVAAGGLENTLASLRAARRQPED